MGSNPTGCSNGSIVQWRESDLAKVGMKVRVLLELQMGVESFCFDAIKLG